MNDMNVGTSSKPVAVADKSGKHGIDRRFADAVKESGIPAAQASAVDRGIARQSMPSNVQSDAVAMPDDADFLVVEDVSVAETANGEEVAVVTGDAVTAEEAEAIAAKGGAVIVPLPDSRLTSRPISGAMFASILLDQRTGALPNPFSLMRLPDPPSAPRTGADPAQMTSGSPPVAPTAGIETRQQTLADAPGGDAVAMGKEISRLEAAMSALIGKLEEMLKSLRVLVGNLARQQGDAKADDARQKSDRADG